jgi:hypothetical protein
MPTATAISASRAPALAHALVDQLAAWPFVRVERRGHCAVVLSGARELAIGTIDLREGRLTIAVPPHMVGAMLARHPLLEPAGRGVRLALSDDEHCAAATRLLRWRIGRVRFAPQAGEASP